MKKIGIISKYNIPDNYDNYFHVSSVKLFKLFSVSGDIFLEKAIKNYNYDYLIVDRYNLVGSDFCIKDYYSEKILNFSEGNPKIKWATHYASASPYYTGDSESFVNLWNYSLGSIHLNDLNKNKINTNLVFIGRVTSEILLKLKFIETKTNQKINIFPIKFIEKNKILRFTNDNDFQINSLILKNYFRNANILKPVNHFGLYMALNAGQFKIGFVPSVYYEKKSKTVQKESSSKFYDYIGAGIPVLIESTVPEAIFVKNNNFIGEIYSSQEELLSKIELMKYKKYNYIDIYNYANKYHSLNIRYNELLNKFIK
jgi:hypothetical protein